MKKFNELNISGIYLPQSISDTFQGLDDERLEILDHLSTVNVFVGANNSGKSLFLRNLAMQSNGRVKCGLVTEVNQTIYKILDDLEAEFTNFKVRELEDDNGQRFIVRTVNEARELIVDDFDFTDDLFMPLKNHVSWWDRIVNIRATVPVMVNPLGRRILVDTIKKAGHEISEKLGYISSDVTPEGTLARVYVPTLRGLRHLSSNSQADEYKKCTEEAYFNNKAPMPPEVFTGLSFYEILIDMLLGDEGDRQRIRRYQDFLRDEIFDGAPVELIPNRLQRAVVVKIGKEKERPIFDLGDGIQSIIILTFLAFTRSESTLFFIEEPEIYLHPGFQRKLMEFFAKQNRHLYFLTTHSNHLLDLTIDIPDISVFNFQKLLTDAENDREAVPRFKVIPVNSDCRSSLELLGVRNSSVFLVNATIWVEGITDRLYFRRLLALYLESLGDSAKKIEEDLHYAFVEYGGSNITHWSFLDYEEQPVNVDHLCAQAMVITDKDGDHSKIERKKALREKLGERFVELSCREVENLLPFDVIRSVVAEYEGITEDDIDKFDYNNYKDEPLGNFIEEHVLKRSHQRKGGYKTASGTLKDKVGFCKKALDKLNFSNLPDESLAVAERIYEFVVARNQ